MIFPAVRAWWGEKIDEVEVLESNQKKSVASQAAIAGGRHPLKKNVDLSPPPPKKPLQMITPAFIVSQDCTLIHVQTES